MLVRSHGSHVSDLSPWTPGPILNVSRHLLEIPRMSEDVSVEVQGGGGWVDASLLCDACRAGQRTRNSDENPGSVHDHSVEST